MARLEAGNELRLNCDAENGRGIFRETAPSKQQNKVTGTKLIKQDSCAALFYLVRRTLGTVDAENTMERLKAQSPIVAQLA